jgi:hypothetical protein
MESSLQQSQREDTEAGQGLRAIHRAFLLILRTSVELTEASPDKSASVSSDRRALQVSDCTSVDRANVA